MYLDKVVQKGGKTLKTLQPRERERPQKQRRSEAPKKRAQKFEKRTPDNLFKKLKKIKEIVT
jgi:5'-3' exonuclease